MHIYKKKLILQKRILQNYFYYLHNFQKLVEYRNKNRYKMAIQNFDCTHIELVKSHATLSYLHFIQSINLALSQLYLHFLNFLS